MADPTKESVLGMIKGRGPGAPQDEPEYEMEDYSNSDALDLDSLEEVPEETPTGEEPEVEEAAAPSSVDWQAVAKQQAEELARYKSEQAEREQADFERRVKELPEGERADFVMNFYRERERSTQVEQVRRELADKHPVATMLMNLMGEDFDMEIDDPGKYAEALAHLDSRGSELLNGFIAESVKKEMDKFYATVGAEWGVNKIGAAQPRPLSPRNPLRAQYEEARSKLAKPGSVKNVDKLTALIRKRELAKRGIS